MLLFGTKSCPKAKWYIVPPHEQWLDRAEDDLAFARLGFREKYISQACFLSQQVVEKSLKGFLLARGRTYPRLHKVVELAKLCVKIAGDLEPLKDNLKLVDEFYLPTRYVSRSLGPFPTKYRLGFQSSEFLRKFRQCRAQNLIHCLRFSS